MVVIYRKHLKKKKMDWNLVDKGNRVDGADISKAFVLLPPGILIKYLEWYKINMPDIKRMKT